MMNEDTKVNPDGMTPTKPFDNRRSISGSVNVTGKIEAEVPASLIKCFEETLLNGTRDTRRNFRIEIVTVVINVCTLLAVALYTTLAGLQWKETAAAVNAAREANLLTEESIRGRIELRFKFVAPPQPNSPVSVAFTLKNSGQTPVLLGEWTGFGEREDMPSGDMPVPKSDKIPLRGRLAAGEESLSAIPDPVAATQAFLDGLPSALEIVNNQSTSKRTKYFFARISYETLGKKHTVEFCVFMARADSATNSFDSPLKNDKYVLATCPKWNSSN